MKMKTTFILLACLLVTTGANIRKKCNNKAEEIALQDCKQQCDAASRGEDCAKCIRKHQDYDEDCKGMRSMKCIKHEADIAKEYCKEQCNFSAQGPDFDFTVCDTCITNHQDFDTDCKNAKDMII